MSKIADALMNFFGKGPGGAAPQPSGNAMAGPIGTGFIAKTGNMLSPQQVAESIYYQNFLDAFPGQSLPGGLTMPVAPGQAAPPAQGPVQGVPTPVGSPIPANAMMGGRGFGALIERLMAARARAR